MAILPLLMTLQKVFLESLVTDQNILEENARSIRSRRQTYGARMKLPGIRLTDRSLWVQNLHEAAKLYLKRTDMITPNYETMNDPDLNYAKMISVSERLGYSHASFR